ncbi:replication initiation protein [Senegalia sp. (in: firmicutes)]|uniref:replication initiation protein n=1 Tax=Senegalia sp. (in: firmicutes) TaxID=1924098 RepID=UPI003F9A0892
MSDLVVYKDEMNTVPLRNFNSKEMDLFFSICSKMRDEDLNTITFDFNDLKELSNYKMTATEHFTADLENIYSKLIQLDFRLESKEKIIKFVLFTKYEIDKINETISLRVNEEFKHILNNIFDNFTKFELEEFTTLRSSYSKTAYRLLKQFRQSGYYIVQIDEFRRLFDVPESYQMSDIDKRILDRIKDELPTYFKNLIISKLRGKGKRKRFIEHIEFKFDPETDIKKGEKLFRDKNTGEYYKKSIMDFTDEEVKKAFPEVKPASDFNELKKQMGLSKEKYTEKQINTIYQTAIEKVLESDSTIGVFEYIRLSNQYVNARKDIKSKYSYLISTLKNDYAIALDQIRI